MVFASANYEKIARQKLGSFSLPPYLYLRAPFQTHFLCKFVFVFVSVFKKYSSDWLQSVENL